MDAAAKESAAEDKRAPDVSTMISIAMMHRHAAKTCFVEEFDASDLIVQSTFMSLASSSCVTGRPPRQITCV